MGRKAQYDYIDVNKLLLDPENPRFHGQQHKQKDQHELRKYLINDYDALALRDSIEKNGFMPYEPLIVREHGQKFVVIEGNRRLAAVLTILEETPASVQAPNLKKIPCIIFNEKDRQSEQTYLGLRHFSGYKNWSPQSKAEYLVKQLKAGVSIDELALRINSNISQIKRYVIALGLFSKVDEKSAEDAPTDFRKFWLMAEAISRPAVQQYVDLRLDAKSFNPTDFNHAKFKKLCRYLYGSTEFDTQASDKELGPVISDTRQIGSLSKVLASENATKVLESTGDIEAALKLVTPRNTLGEVQKEIIKMIKGFISLKPDQKTKDNLLTDIKKILR